MVATHLIERLDMSRLIKKYKNRRLYDTELSQYITIEDLYRYVVDEVDFNVQEASTGKDITNATLLQILVEMEASPSPFLSSLMLRHIIQLAAHPMSQTLRGMLSESMAMLDKQVKKEPYWQGINQTSDVISKQMQTLFDQWQSFLAKK